MIEACLLEHQEAKKKQSDKLCPLLAASINPVRDKILIDWIYNSNAIEGSMITLQETRPIPESGLIVGGKSLREPKPGFHKSTSWMQIQGSN